MERSDKTGSDLGLHVFILLCAASSLVALILGRLMGWSFF